MRVEGLSLTPIVSFSQFVGTFQQQRPLPLSLRASQDVMSPSPSGPTIHELDGDSILPDTDSEILSNTITLHVPVTGLKEVMDTKYAYFAY